MDVPVAHLFLILNGHRLGRVSRLGFFQRLHALGQAVHSTPQLGQAALKFRGGFQLQKRHEHHGIGYRHVLCTGIGHGNHRLVLVEPEPAKHLEIIVNRRHLTLVDIQRGLTASVGNRHRHLLRAIGSVRIPNAHLVLPGSFQLGREDHFLLPLPFPLVVDVIFAVEILVACGLHPVADDISLRIVDDHARPPGRHLDFL